MKLSARILTDVQSVNSFTYNTEQGAWKGDSIFVYFQLVDMDKNLAQYGFNPSGLRYNPPATSTVTVTFLNIDSAKQFSRQAVQPFPQDASIWRVSILATDPVDATQQLKFQVLEPGSIQRTFVLNAAICSEIP